MAIEFIEVPDSDEIPVTNENKFIGMRVKAGRDWNYGNSPSNPKDSIGTIISLRSLSIVSTPPEDWVRVRWDNGEMNSYMTQGAYDLYVVFE